MKLGVLTVPLQGMPAEEAFAYLHGLGVETVELGTGGYTNNNHLKPEVYLNDDGKIEEFKQLLKKNELEISVLSCHGNPVHPDKATAEMYHNVFVDTCKLAQKLGVDTIVTFSGCPGDCPESKRPNWVTCAWPPEYGETLEYQWNDVLIPYWKKAADIAKSYGVKKIAFEMHPGFCVYNPATLLRLRAAVGDILGANFDPSHLLWQGITPHLFLQDFIDRVYHVHMKDARVTLDGRSGLLGSHIDFGDLRRGWNFRSLGHGGVDFEEIIRVLNAAGYDGPLSVEWEDSGMDRIEGATEAAAFVRKVDFKPSTFKFDDAISNK